jgi:hypothetical protein
MYILPSFINYGLKEGQEWPSEAHQVVAGVVALCNPNVTTRDRLNDIVQAILKIPVDRIETVTYPQLISEFGVPDVGIYTTGA